MDDQNSTVALLLKCCQKSICLKYGLWGLFKQYINMIESADLESRSTQIDIVFI